MFSSFFPVLLQLFPVSSAGGSSCVEDQAELLGITTTRGQCLSNNRLETQFVFTLQITLNTPKNMNFLGHTVIVKLLLISVP